MNVFFQYIHSIEPLRKVITPQYNVYQQYQYKHTKTSSSKKYQSIPKSIRQIVWYDFVKRPEPIVFCPCCQTRILTPFTFEAGHIQSRKNGGGNSSSNLLPICRLCNMSMNSMNWTDYIKQYYGDERLAFDLKAFDKLNKFNSKE
jgi:hypothetical protein